MAPSSTLTSPSSTSSPEQTQSPASSNKPAIAVAVALLILVIVTVVGITLFVLRRRRRATGPSASHPTPRASRKSGQILDYSHPAARITPFGSDGPRFHHTPGTNMRIATRRPDGAWEFSIPHGPLTPAGISDIDPFNSPVTPTSSSAAPSIYSQSYSNSRAAKEEDRKRELARSRRELNEEDLSYIPDPDLLPPPAYVYGGVHANRDSSSSFGGSSRR